MTILFFSFCKITDYYFTKVQKKDRESIKTNSLILLGFIILAK